ncbi:Amino acid adenylation domain-containing protein OS=Streptomyces tendae OX=1932 GN=GUR47_06010 PE=4 SV=1 [Streptomyces tendae]
MATDVDALRRPGDTLAVTGIVNEGAPHYPLTLVVERTPDGRPRFSLIHDAELLEESGVREILRTFTRNLTALLTRPDARVGELASEDSGRAEPVAPTTLGELFDTAARRAPAATAVTQCALDGSVRCLTYGELAAAKDELAAALCAAGSVPAGGSPSPCRPPSSRSSR